jgi:serine/threonine protein kinase
MSSSCVMEEDQHPDYASRRFYPVRVGEIILGRYRIVSKLGWGASSTVWLAQDANRLASLSDLINAH